MRSPSKLKNKYTGEIVYCRSTQDVVDSGHGYVYYRVYKKEQPDRTFLVNREAYLIVD